MKKELYQMTVDEVLYSDATPEEKLCMCFKKCHYKIPYYLKYAILEWQQAHLKELGRCFPIPDYFKEEDF